MSVSVCAVLVSVCVCGSVLAGVYAKPTIYVKNDHDKLEPALVAVSSTVIPLPVYKVGYGVSIQGPKPPRPPGDHKLITAASKKKAGLKNGGTAFKIIQHKDDAKKDIL